MRRSNLVVLIATVAALVIPAACAGDDGTNPSTTGTENPSGPSSAGIEYRTFSPPGNAQCVAVGLRFALALDAQPSEGFRWTVESPVDVPAPDEIVTLAGTEFVTDSSTAPGATEIQRISFAAAKLGTTDITVRYVQPTGTPVEATPAETWNITVTQDGTCPAPPVDTTLPLED